MKIVIIFTGGTIGSTVGEDGYIAPNADSPYRLISSYQKENDSSDIIFEAKEPYRILSENIQAEHINKLILTVTETLSDKTVDGIIITHGTDTLQYTSAILNYVFGTDTIPIVLVSSDFPLEDKRANGLCNFKYAVEFIKGNYGRGVFASYKNQEQNPVIHRGTRMLRHIAYSADMLSVENQVYGYFSEMIFYKMETDNKNGYKTMQDFCGSKEITLKDCSKEMLCVFPYPGMSYPQISDKVKVILHDSYHSGTIAVSEELKAFAAKAKEKNIPFYITGVPYHEKEYETVKEYESIGIRVLKRMSPLAAYCKLWLAVSMGCDMEAVMQKRVAADII